MRKSLFVALAALLLLASCHKESSEKKILEFKFASPEVKAVITENAKTIVAVVPFGTDVTALVPIITVSDKATVSPASGMPVNFTNPVVFTVTAEDGSTTTYVATVTVDQNGGGGGGGGGTGDPTTVSGSISANTTWPDLGLDVDYIIEGWFYIEGNALLTIEPGVTIMFTGENGRLIVEQDAGLRMVGTPDKHIKLVNPTNNQNHGAWSDVLVHSNRADNKFEYVEFINGGSDNDVILVDGDAKLSVKNCIIDGSLSNGIDVRGTLTAFENNTIKNCENYPVIMNLPIQINQLGTGNTYVNNAYNMFYLDYYWLDNENVHTFTFANHGIPYYLVDGINVDENSIMIAEAGCEFVLPYDKHFVVNDGCLIQANGTASQPVVFRGETDEAGSWAGVLIHTERATNGGSNLTNCVIQGAGINEDGCLLLDYYTRLTIENLTVRNSATYGLNIDIPMEWNDETQQYEYDFANYHVNATGITFSNCASGNIWERNKGVVLSEWPN